MPEAAISEIVVDDYELSIEVEGEEAGKVATDLRDRFYRVVQALEDPDVATPADAEPHPATIAWERLAEEEDSEDE
ncbi:hypothetical protein C500_20935 [Natrialba magadii ATCC 43099]|nr:hypothetical protein [Natrialba magadii]ELY22969.1 hypothetical protein C500_20935 [Natrialba magadii ATCC 43099]